jgi:hypothetical protein
MQKLHQVNNYDACSEAHPQATDNLAMDRAIFMLKDINEAFDNQKYPRQKSNNINRDRVEIATA